MDEYVPQGPVSGSNRQPTLVRWHICGSRGHARASHCLKRPTFISHYSSIKSEHNTMASISAPKLTVGYLGIGIMGEACARNLLKSGLFVEVHVWNRSAAKVRVHGH